MVSRQYPEDLSILMQLGQTAVSHRPELEEVKRRVGVSHNYFDCWIYGFLENKNFNIEETVAKLVRRDAMERNELANYDITDYMKETMAKGIIQLIGDDKEGRVTFYINSRRDFPTSKTREENKRNFDMWVSYGSRLRKENQRCRITMLINHSDASMWANADMTFQADVALRIAKYYPGAVDRMYICKMNRTLAALAKPIFSRMPKVVSERMHIITESDIAKGKLLELFDIDVLPVALGGNNPCDGPSNWNAFRDTITNHFLQLKAAIHSGKGVKEWELDQLLKETTCEDSVSQTGSGKVPTAPAVRRRDHPTVGAPALGDRRGHHNFQQQATQPFRDGADDRVASRVTADDTAVVDAADGHELEVISDTGTLLTCDDDDDDGEGAAFAFDDRPHAHGSFLTSPNRQRQQILEWSSGVPCRTMSGAGIADSATLLEMYEATFRNNLVELEAMDLLTIVERFGPPPIDPNAANEPSSHNALIGAGEMAILARFPRPVRSIIRGTLWVLCVTLAFYFLIATIFAASVGCSMMTSFYYAMMSEPFMVYPYGLALLVTGYQTSMVCSRGYELARTSFRGRTPHALRQLGVREALQIQAALFFMVTLVLFIVFCVYASQLDPVTGIQYSIACGWIICSVVVLLYHIAFLVGVRGEAPLLQADGKESTTPRRNPNVSGASLYFFLDVTERYDDADDEMLRGQRAGLMYASVPVVVALLAGVAFMLNINQVFLIGAICFTVASGYLINFLTEGDSWDHSATLIRTTVAFASISWLYVVTSIGFFGARGKWGASLGVLLVTNAVWILCSLGSAKFSESAGRRQWLFRLGVIIFFAHLITSIVMLFNSEWRTGLLITGLGVHSAVAFFRYGATSKVGTLTSTVGFLALVIATVVIGLQLQPTQVYSVPLSSGRLANFSYAANRSSVIASAPEFTACLTRFSTEFDLVAMTIFSAISYAATPVTLQTDLRSFFPTFYVVDGSSLTFSSRFTTDSVSSLRLRVFKDTLVTNTTVVSLSNSASDLYGLVEKLTMWVEAMALAPISLIIPDAWAESVVREMSRIATEIAPLRWKSDLNDFSEEFYAFVLTEREIGQEVVVVAHDLSSGFGSIVGSVANAPTITVGGPGMRFSVKRFGIAATYDLEVIPVAYTGSTLTLVGGMSKKAVLLDCNTQNQNCRSAIHFVETLQAACYP